MVAEVPFVDALNTMLDPSLPLTVTEWEEWGDPRDPVVAEEMAGYAPYENVAEVAYPPLLATAGLNDPRVGYHEPAKWVAKLRAIGEGRSARSCSRPSSAPATAARPGATGPGRRKPRCSPSSSPSSNATGS